jgi:hypothetical protein
VCWRPSLGRWSLRAYLALNLGPRSSVIYDGDIFQFALYVGLLGGPSRSGAARRRLLVEGRAGRKALMIRRAGGRGGGACGLPVAFVWKSTHRHRSVVLEPGAPSESRPRGLCLMGRIRNRTMARGLRCRSCALRLGASWEPAGERFGYILRMDLVVESRPSDVRAVAKRSRRFPHGRVSCVSSWTESLAMLSRKPRAARIGAASGSRRWLLASVLGSVFGRLFLPTGGTGLQGIAGGWCRGGGPLNDG